MTETTEITWENTIKGYFTAKDVACMKPYGVLLDDYDYVSDKSNASQIYSKVKSGAMPKGEPPWSEEWVNNFKEWAQNGAPQG